MSEQEPKLISLHSAVRSTWSVWVYLQKVQHTQGVYSVETACVSRRYLKSGHKIQLHEDETEEKKERWKTGGRGERGKEGRKEEEGKRNQETKEASSSLGAKRRIWEIEKFIGQPRYHNITQLGNDYESYWLKTKRQIPETWIPLSEIHATISWNLFSRMQTGMHLSMFFIYRWRIGQ